MSESSSSEDSVPRLSSYPPAFVSLITTFIKRAEEAETRAHKALVILRAKDELVQQLQQRMDVLEKIACRLEEVMVPPLDLPRSPEAEELDGPHPRDVNNKKSNNPALETLYERFPRVRQTNDSAHIQNVHNCYEKCQHLIDGLERSNCQLREALAAESQQRVKDHEQYLATLAKVTQAVKELQSKQVPTEKQNLCSQSILVQPIDCENLPTHNETIFCSGDTESKIKINGKNKSADSESKNQFALFHKEEFKRKVELAESIISVLQDRLEKGRNYKSIKIMKIKQSKRSVRNTHSKGSLNSQNSSRSFKLRRIHFSPQCFQSALRKKNKELKIKYQLLSEKFTESLILCEKLQKDLISMSNKNNKIVISNKVNQYAQTEDIFRVSISNHQEKPVLSRSVNLLQGRLEAAAKVMAKQCKQIQELQKKLVESHGKVEFLRKRLARSESTAAGKELFGETTKKQLQETEEKNLALTLELQHTNESLTRLRLELSLKCEENCKIKKEKEICELTFEEMKRSLESKLFSLEDVLQQKEELNDKITNQLESKLSSLREQFIAQVTEASDRLVAADFKIQELYLGIETFLKLLFSLNSPELTPSSQAQAVSVASDILQMPPGEVQTILHSSRCDLRVNQWIRDCNRLVYDKVFAKNLGQLLLDAVLEARIA